MRKICDKQKNKTPDNYLISNINKDTNKKTFFEKNL